MTQAILDWLGFLFAAGVIVAGVAVVLGALMMLADNLRRR